MAPSSSPTSAVEDGLARLTSRRGEIDAELERLCERHIPSIPGRVAEAIRYALLGEGKRMRGALVIAAYEGAGGKGDPLPLAAAVEVVHAYSLVHDDLPCMDDDAVRRGRPTAHVRFGVRAATAAGVAMVPLAVRAAWDAGAALRLPPPVRGDIVSELMRAGGGGGMIGGQLLDLDAEGRRVELEELERIHRGKTGALITAAARVGAMAAGAATHQVAALGRYGAAVGLAFQIADDVLDVTSTTRELGKTAGKDAARSKSTYPTLLGIDGARARAAGLVKEACDALDTARVSSPALRALAQFAVARRS